jgi:drug/metabolite transporter superfamily protein YnfA
MTYAPPNNGRRLLIAALTLPVLAWVTLVTYIYVTINGWYQVTTYGDVLKNSLGYLFLFFTVDAAILGLLSALRRRRVYEPMFGVILLTVFAVAATGAASFAMSSSQFATYLKRMETENVTMMQNTAADRMYLAYGHIGLEEATHLHELTRGDSPAPYSSDLYDPSMTVSIIKDNLCSQRTQYAADGSAHQGHLVCTAQVLDPASEASLRTILQHMPQYPENGYVLQQSRAALIQAAAEADKRLLWNVTLHKKTVTFYDNLGHTIASVTLSSLSQPSVATLVDTTVLASVLYV